MDHPKEASSRGRPPGLPQPDSPVDGDRTKRVPKTAGVGRTPKESAPNTKRLDRRQTIHQTPQNVWKTGRGPYAIPPAEASPGARLVPIDDPPDHRPRGLLPTSSSSTAVILSRVPRWGRFHCPQSTGLPRGASMSRRPASKSLVIGTYRSRGQIVPGTFPIAPVDLHSKQVVLPRGGESRRSRDRHNSRTRPPPWSCRRVPPGSACRHRGRLLPSRGAHPLGAQSPKKLIGTLF